MTSDGGGGILTKLIHGGGVGLPRHIRDHTIILEISLRNFDTLLIFLSGCNR